MDVFGKLITQRTYCARKGEKKSGCFWSLNDLIVNPHSKTVLAKVMLTSQNTVKTEDTLAY